MSRRQLLKVVGFTAGGAALLAGTGVGIYEWVTPSASSTPPPYRSRPDINPPQVTIEVPAADTAPGYVFLTPAAGPGQYGPMIVDNHGALVWFRQIVPPAQFHVATNLKVQQYRGRPVLTWWEGMVLVPPGYGVGEYVIADHTYSEITRVKAGNGLKGDLHEFTLTDKGTALFTAYQPKRGSLASVGGPAQGIILDSFVQEVDVASGEVLFQWSAMDHVGLDESYAQVEGTSGDGNEYDFFHANSIDVDTDGNLIVSARNTWTIYKIDRQSGEIIWRLNGKLSDFEVSRDSQFEYQHCANRAPSGLLTVFDDGGGPDVAVRSRGLALSVDETTHKVTLAEQYLSDPNTLADSQGSVQTLPNTNVFVGWGAQPYASEYSSDGRLLFDLSLPDQSVSYRAFRFEWTGRPKGLPAVAVDQGPGNDMTVYVSWNGATEVDSWRVLAGQNAGTLVPVATARREGFETAITVPSRPAVAVSALDRTGHVLATTKVQAT